MSISRKRINLATPGVVAFITTFVNSIALAGFPLATFDDGTFQGWTPFMNPGAAEVNVIPFGGNPGGYVTAFDNAPGGGTFGIEAPAFYLDILDEIDAIQWDERFLQKADLVQSTQVILTGDDGTRYRNVIGPGPVGVWRTRVANFNDPMDWQLINGTATYQQVLASATAIQIAMDVTTDSASPESDVDNVMFIPEPATLVLLATGIVFRRKRGRTSRSLE